MGFLPCFWVGDVLSEVVVAERVHSWGVGALGDVVGGVQEFPVGGKGFVFYFELDGH